MNSETIYTHRSRGLPYRRTAGGNTLLRTAWIAAAPATRTERLPDLHCRAPGAGEFIKKAQTLGLSLEEIREVMELKFSGTSPCQHVRDLLREKLSAVDQQIARLRAFRRELADSLIACEESLRIHRTSPESCPVLERLNIERRKRWE